MEVERRERDPDTGERIGAGFSDVFAKIAAKLTGKTASKLATKAAEKAAEKVGEKTGQLVGEKIYDKFSSKPAEGRSKASKGRPETKGKEIGEMLAASAPPSKSPTRSKNSKFQKINNVYADLL